MFVSDSTLNFGGTKLQLISTEGYSWSTAFDPSATVDNIKKLAIQFFYPQEDHEGSSTTAEQFRVIYPAERRTLQDHHCLHEEKLKDNDILLFIRRRSYSTSTAPTTITTTIRHTDTLSTPRDTELKPPTAAQILAATKDLQVPPRPSAISSGSPPLQNLQQSINHHYHTFGSDDFTDFPESEAVDFQLELRKIIISLISVMGRLLRANEDATLILEEMHGRIKNRLKAVASKPVEGTNFTYPSLPKEENFPACTPEGIVMGLVEVKKREFRPNPKALESLREMGFKDEEIVEALRQNKNGKDAACEWLISGKGKKGTAVDLVQNNVDDVTGLDQSSHLFMALVNAPVVRLGLNSPKTLLAFLNILESPQSANTWLNDQDTAPVLSAIFKIYHAEKHAAPIGQQQMQLQGDVPTSSSNST